ncbi:MAG: UxaA family hydrolase, partial [Bacillus sp. (in: firmicutes)]
MKDFLQITENDNIILALRNFKKSEIIHLNGKNIQIKEDISRGHKIAVKDIYENEDIIKYGYPIGHALGVIAPGEHVHTHNTKTNLSGTQEYQYMFKESQNLFKNENRTFQGYRREYGNVGIRNELWIVPTVGCVNG